MKHDNGAQSRSTSCILNPSLKYHYGANDCLYILDKGRNFVVNNKVSQAILSEIDGTKTDDEITEVLSTAHNQAEIYYELRKLIHCRFVIRKQDVNSIEDASYSTGMDYEAIREITGTYCISVHADDSNMHESISSVFLDLGLPYDKFTGKESVKIVVCNDYLNPNIVSVMQSCLNRGNYCFPAKVNDSTLWFGPLLHKSQKICWECVTRQVRNNRPVESYLAHSGIQMFGQGEESFISPAKLSFVSRLITLRLLYTLSNTCAVPPKPVIEALDIGTFELKKHCVRKIPQCPTCGDPEIFTHKAREAVILGECEKPFRSDGGYRSISPEETWVNYQHLVSPITGIISSIGPMSSKNHSLRPVFGAAHFVNPPVSEVKADQTFVTSTFGKGLTPFQARVSALCEAVERYAAMYQGDEPVVTGSYREFRNDAISPIELMNFSAKQCNNNNGNPAEKTRDTLPLPFDDSCPIEWTCGWSLTQKRMRLLPATYCYSYFPTDDNRKFCTFNSNGNAAGNTLEEAILQGLLELIERDAVGIWWYNRIQRPAVNLVSFEEKYFIDLCNHYNSMEWDLWVLDCTNNIKIPTAVSIAQNRQTSGFIIGMGTHIEMRLAVQRAVTEMNQVFDKKGSPLWSCEEFENTRFLTPHPRLDPVRADYYSQPVNKFISDDILECQKILESLGMELIVLNYTRPDIKVPTVKVIVPGLRHFWPRFGPGRLFDVPVKMGWLTKPLREDELNSKSLLL